MKVFGVGLNKTGTTTLGKALEILGYTDHVGYREDLCVQYYQGKIDEVLAIAYNYNNFEDLPWPLLYAECFESFNESKFILTKRSSSSIWLESYVRHAKNKGPKMVRELVYGREMPNGYEEEFVSVYERHIQSVERFFSSHAPERLLSICFEHDQGWSTLCDFLDKPIPEVDFPWLNKGT